MGHFLDGGVDAAVPHQVEGCFLPDERSSRSQRVPICPIRHELLVVVVEVGNTHAEGIEKEALALFSKGRSRRSLDEARQEKVSGVAVEVLRSWFEIQTLLQGKKVHHVVF